MDTVAEDTANRKSEFLSFFPQARKRTSQRIRAFFFAQLSLFRIANLG